jgi:hypothetical protein
MKQETCKEVTTMMLFEELPEEEKNLIVEQGLYKTLPGIYMPRTSWKFIYEAAKVLELEGSGKQTDQPCEKRPSANRSRDCVHENTEKGSGRGKTDEL